LLLSRAETATSQFATAISGITKLTFAIFSFYLFKRYFDE
jgi:hypothetical protein